MAQIHADEFHDGYPPPQSSGGGCLKALGIGCGVVVVLLIVAVVVVVWNFKRWATNIGRTAIVQTVEASKLPVDQKRRIIARVDQVAEDYKAGRITDQQLGRVVEEIQQSPLLPLGAVYFARQQYIDPSGLPADEKEDARLQLERFARGVYEGTIKEEAIDEVVEPISKPGTGDQIELKERATDDEIRRMVAAAQRHADEAEVPVERFEVNVADELELAIDRALGRAPRAPPVDEERAPAAQEDQPEAPEEAEPAQVEPPQ